MLCRMYVQCSVRQYFTYVPIYLRGPWDTFVKQGQKSLSDKSGMTFCVMYGGGHLCCRTRVSHLGCDLSAAQCTWYYRYGRELSRVPRYLTPWRCFMLRHDSICFYKTHIISMMTCKRPQCCPRVSESHLFNSECQTRVVSDTNLKGILFLRESGIDTVWLDRTANSALTTRSKFWLYL